MSTASTRALIAGLVIGLAAGLYIGGQTDRLGDGVADLIEENYFEEIETSELEDASIRGMVRELRERYDDRFSHYFDVGQLRQFNQATSGSFSGIGLSVREVKRGLRVTTVFDDTPAKRAGVREGDEILAVDGRSIAGKPADLATGMIKGPLGRHPRDRARASRGAGARRGGQAAAHRRA